MPNLFAGGGASILLFGTEVKKATFLPIRSTLGILMDHTRRAGVLLHPTAFPGECGIGELGPEAYQFIDWMAEGGQTLWQVMPLGPTGYGDSPYQCTSAFAGNPMIISLELLRDEGLLTDADLAPLKKLPKNAVDFGAVIPLKNELLRKAYDKFEEVGDSDRYAQIAQFVQRYHSWLEDFTLFTALKNQHDGKSWVEWPEPLRDRHTGDIEQAKVQLEHEISYLTWLQFLFFEQWWKVRHYASQKGIQIMGDIPLFVAHDSADVWARRELFHLDGQGNPTVVAGVPPDYFSATGQRWGNPLFAWDMHRAEGFHWWESRFRITFDLVDWVRIDHFRGLEAYWEIPGSEETAVKGRWVNAPGVELFGTLLGRIPEMKVVAEDLGVITREVVSMRKQFTFPGMRVLQFAWGSGPENSFLPHNYEPDSVVYTGTHDNNTTVGWSKSEMTEEMGNQIAEYIGHKPDSVTTELIRLAYASVAAIAVVPMQDWLEIGAEGRMNTPSQPSGNWSWRAEKSAFNDELASRMNDLAHRYARFYFEPPYGDPAV